MTDGQNVITIAHLEHFVHRWAKNQPDTIRRTFLKFSLYIIFFAADDYENIVTKTSKISIKDSFIVE